jgi:hypothetical protein
MEQEQLTNQPQAKGEKSPTTPIKIETKVKQSQKQKKKAKMSQQHETSTSPELDSKPIQETEKEEPKIKANPW